MATVVLEENKKYRKIINILAIAIPVAVAVLIGIRQKIDLGTMDKDFASCYWHVEHRNSYSSDSRILFY